MIRMHKTLCTCAKTYTPLRFRDFNKDFGIPAKISGFQHGFFMQSFTFIPVQRLPNCFGGACGFCHVHACATSAQFLQRLLWFVYAICHIPVYAMSAQLFQRLLWFLYAVCHVHACAMSAQLFQRLLWFVHAVCHVPVYATSAQLFQRLLWFLYAVCSFLCNVCSIVSEALVVSLRSLSLLRRVEICSAALVLCLSSQSCSVFSCSVSKFFNVQPEHRGQIQSWVAPENVLCTLGAQDYSRPSKVLTTETETLY